MCSDENNIRHFNSLQSILEEEVRFGKYIPTAENFPIRPVCAGQKYRHLSDMSTLYNCLGLDEDLH